MPSRDKASRRMVAHYLAVVRADNHAQIVADAEQIGAAMRVASPDERRELNAALVRHGLSTAAEL